MSPDFRSIPLLLYLRDRHPEYYGKALEVRDSLSGWLAYIPQAFPHYTRHTIEHSDEITLRISSLLFDDSGTAWMQLSGAEAYILVAAAYLHDAGMVVSDKEKSVILASEQWKTWTTEGGGATRWSWVSALREDVAINGATRHFLADVQTRFLIAEFVRHTHHSRAGPLHTGHQQALGRFAFDDPVLLRTLTDVCVAHGLRAHELEDSDRFPLLRDVRGEPVNVRLMAVLLRLGDLLDMSSDRACPLLLNAASPVPPDSLAHWSQYQRITHRAISRSRIEITAECLTQEEHRVLQDWCQWIADEVKDARALMAGTERHKEWRPPAVKLQEPDATIVIRPAETASYFFSNWTFELDTEAIFDRLVHDVQNSPYSFVRELLQNALDANRSQMYADLISAGREPPEYPTQVDGEWRAQYPVTITLTAEPITNPLSGESESRQTLVIDDVGIGMDREIIERYFLQVGRSYYATEEFRRAYRFIPTSGFGVGFLTVFAASDHVIVETLKPSGMDGPIQLTLTGPRNYLLTDRGSRTRSGTSVRVTLRDGLREGELTRLITDLCRRVEFPIEVNDLGRHTTVTAETPNDFESDTPDLSQGGGRWLVKSFPIDEPGVEGEIYVFAHLSEAGEDWSRWHLFNEEYARQHSIGDIPRLPLDLRCFHGINIHWNLDPEIPELRRLTLKPPTIRLDYRRQHRLTVSRRGTTQTLDSEVSRIIASRLENLVASHLGNTRLALSDDGWRYKQRLVEYFPIPSFWASEPACLRIYRDGVPSLVSLNELREVDPICIVIDVDTLGYQFDSKVKEPSEVPMAVLRAVPSSTFPHGDLRSVSHMHRQELFQKRSPQSAELNGRFLVLRFGAPGNDSVIWTHGGDSVFVAELPTPLGLGFELEGFYGLSHNMVVANASDPVIAWMVAIQDACERMDYGLTQFQFQSLLSILFDRLTTPPVYKEAFAKHLESWRQLPGLPAHLTPPRSS